MRYATGMNIMLMQAHQQAGVAGAAPGTAPANDINETAARPEPAVDYPEGELPEQMGGQRTTLMPGIYTFLLPTALPQLWDEVEQKDTREFLADGRANPTFNQLVKRTRLKFDRNAPLVVVGGPSDGLPFTATYTNAPRARGKKEDPKTPWISELAYLLEVSLGDKSRPKMPADLRAAVNRYAGKTIRLETGLSGQCRPDKVRYVQMEIDGAIQNIADPSGIKGCGSRFYTKQFKNADAGQLDQAGAAIPQYETELPCTCGPQPTPQQVQAGAVPLPPGTDVVIRGYESTERFLPPLGQK